VEEAPKAGAKEEEKEADGGEESVSSSTCSTSSTSSGIESDKTSGDESDEEEEQGGGEEQEEAENWAEWIKRATNLAEAAAKKAGLVDWVEEQRRRKWRWAGHVARRDDGRWSRRLLRWEPHGGRRSWGRPALRWEDTICQFMRNKGEAWLEAAQDRFKWSSWEDEFASARW
jgi:hypothetical protein